MINTRNYMEKATLVALTSTLGLTGCAGVHKEAGDPIIVVLPEDSVTPGDYTVVLTPEQREEVEKASEYDGVICRAKVTSLDGNLLGIDTSLRRYPGDNYFSGDRLKAIVSQEGKVFLVENDFPENDQGVSGIGVRRIPENVSEDYKMNLLNIVINGIRKYNTGQTDFNVTCQKVEDYIAKN